MPQLHSQTYLREDPATAKRRLLDILANPHEPFALRVSLADFGIPGNLKLEKEIVVTANLQRDDANLNDVLAVRFEASDSAGIYPSFSGILDVNAGEPGSVLDLVGTYDPPGGAAGRAFDATIGYLIAQRSMSSFLDDLAQKISSDRVETGR